MRFLVLGQGGREHALVKALKFSPTVSEVHASPGSDGISQDAICHALDWNDQKAIEAFIKKYKFDCVLVGPENYLVAGVSDHIRALGVPVVGPSQIAARLEGSKIFAKEFMVRAGIPTAKYQVVEDLEGTMAEAKDFTPPYVLKADGLAAGKGVFVCPTLEELKNAAEFLFVKKGLGEAGRKALLEQFQSGYELSYLILTNGEDSQALPVAQDHKRLADGDKGPNTGGMGVVGPISVPADLRQRIEDEIVAKSVRQLAREGLLYRGVLYIGLMITADGPTVIEYNARFGDPECQVIMPQLEGDWAQVFTELAKGNLHPLKWKSLQLACVVLAAPGYPDNAQKGVVIEGDLGHQTSSSYFLHAGTGKSPAGEWITSGGRVLNAIGMGSTRAEALTSAYAQARAAKWKGVQLRKDIGSNLPAEL